MWLGVGQIFKVTNQMLDYVIINKSNSVSSEFWGRSLNLFICIYLLLHVQAPTVPLDGGDLPSEKQPRIGYLGRHVLKIFPKKAACRIVFFDEKPLFQ